MTNMSSISCATTCGRRLPVSKRKVSRAAPSATRVGASYPQYVFRAAAISAFTSRITQQLIGRATELALLSERCTLYLRSAFRSGPKVESKSCQACRGRLPARSRAGRAPSARTRVVTIPPCNSEHDDPGARGFGYLQLFADQACFRVGGHQDQNGEADRRTNPMIRWH